MADEFLNELETNKKLACLSADKTRVNHVLSFVKSRQLTLQEIDEQFLRKFRGYLMASSKISERSIVNYLVVIRTIFNRVIKMGIVDKKLYPFGSDKIRIKFPETEKVGLTKEEIVDLENVENLSENEKHAGNVWLFSFYIARIRTEDVLKIRWNDIYDGRLHYRMDKNSKLLSLRIPDKANDILEHYRNGRNSNNDFVFPEMKKANLKDPKDVYAKVKAANKKFNKYLQDTSLKQG